MLAYGIRAGITDQVVNDMPIWNHKIYQENPILCDGDGPIHQYRKWFSQFYAEWRPAPVRAVSRDRSLTTDIGKSGAGEGENRRFKLTATRRLKKNSPQHRKYS